MSRFLRGFRSKSANRTYESLAPDGSGLEIAPTPHAPSLQTVFAKSKRIHQWRCSFSPLVKGCLLMKHVSRLLLTVLVLAVLGVGVTYVFASRDTRKEQSLAHWLLREMRRSEA